MTRRHDDRLMNEIRHVEIIPNFIPSAAGSCLISCGKTRVICTASVDEKVPQFLENAGLGWLTAEYNMLPASTGARTSREKVAGAGRTHEIQRLIGRSLRAALDRKKLGQRTITIDCDVIQADGGTRTASITGGYVALVLAIDKLMRQKLIEKSPIVEQGQGGTSARPRFRRRFFGRYRCESRQHAAGQRHRVADDGRTSAFAVFGARCDGRVGIVGDSPALRSPECGYRSTSRCDGA